MSEYPMARVDFAARFVAPELSFSLVGVHRGTDSVLRIHVTPNLSYGSDLYIWTHGGWDSGSNEYRAPGWSGIGDPWRACDYWGPLIRGATTVARFCGDCGTARIVGSRFCGNCGQPFSDGGTDLPEIRRRVEGACQQGDTAAEVLSDLISQHSLSDLGLAEQGSLTAKIREACASISMGVFIDGSPTSDRSRLTLANAQDVAERVVAGVSLDKQDMWLAEQLLTHAPLHFGWWGPFKALVKHLDPGVMPEAYGKALARLHMQLPGYPAIANREAEDDMGFLATVFTNPTPGTANYMRRRARRDLVQLAESQPAVYTTVVASMLAEWDSDVKSTSFAPAYALFGGEPYLNERSRAVVTRVDQSIRRYAHPEVWIQFPNAARELVGSVSHSVEVFTFARQVLESAGIDAPALSRVSLPLALRSTDRALREEGRGRLAYEPECWDSLDRNIWTDFFRAADDDDVLAATSGLLARERIGSVTQVAATLLGEHLNEGNGGLSALRLEALARIYLAYTSSGNGGYRWSRDADVAAVLVLGGQHDLSRAADAWRSAFEFIPAESLIVALNLLYEQQGVPPGSTSFITELIAQPATAWQIEERVITCLATAKPSMRDLAWRLISQLDEREAIFVRIADWLKTSNLDANQRVATLQDLLREMPDHQVSEVLTSIVSDPIWGFIPEQVSALLSGSREAATLLWSGLAAEDPEVIVRLMASDPGILILVGDALSAASTMNMTEAQVTVVEDYIRIRPDRIAQDPAFGVSLACLPHPNLQAQAIDQLISADLLGRHWLTLAESGLPAPQLAAWNYVESMTLTGALTEAVLAAIDSPEVEVRNFGLRMLDARRDDLDLDEVWSSLVHSDDPVVQARVVEESLVRDWDDEQLSEFDRRMLVTRRGGRKSKEKIKSRIEELGPAAVAPHRLDALLDMASGANSRDREWSLQRLAHLTLAGVDIEDFQVSKVSQEANHG